MRALLPTVLVSVVLGALFVPFSLTRVVDGDEGFYTYASALVLRGELLYRDFFYPQMPVLPYVYGLWMEGFGESWYAARTLSALLAVAGGVLLYRYLDARVARATAVLGVGFYAASIFVFEWFTVVKSYALATVLVFAAVSLIDRSSLAGAWSWVIAGVLVALAVGSRLYFIAVVAAFGIAILQSSERRRNMIAFASGFGFGAVPILAYLVIDPGRFIWNVLFYQGVRSSGGLVGNFSQKAEIAAGLIGVGAREQILGFQYLILLIGAGAAILLARRLSRPVPLPLWIAAAVGIASFLPTPTYLQYFSVTVPFLIAGTLPLVSAANVSRQGTHALLAVIALVFAFLGGINLHRHLQWSQSAALAPPSLGVSDIESVVAATRLINRYTSPGEEVISSWPGYMVGSHARLTGGLEFQFAAPTAAVISSAEARRYRLLGARATEALVSARRTRLVAYHNWLPPGFVRPDWQQALVSGGYRLLAQVGGTQIFRAPDREGRGTGNVELQATLTGRRRGFHGDPDGDGTALIFFAEAEAGKRICWAISLNRVDDAVAAHIHRNGRPSDRPPVASLRTTFVGSSCVNAPQLVVRDIRRAPEKYYVDVHTTRYWDGALRGTLKR